MNKEVQFLNYEQCFQHYTSRIMNIRQAKIAECLGVLAAILMVAKK